MKPFRFLAGAYDLTNARALGELAFGVALVTPDGALCTVTATGIVYVKWSGTWRNILPTPPLPPILIAGTVNATNNGVIGPGMPQQTYGVCPTPAGYNYA